MGYVTIALQVIQAIPKIIEMIHKLVVTFRRDKNERRKDKMNNGLDMSIEAKTKEEMQRANEESTRNLP